MARCSVGKLDELDPDSLTRVMANGRPVCLARLKTGDVYAISDICSHEEIELSEGDLDGEFVECPSHGSRFDVKTGAVTSVPATKPVPSYPVTIEDGEVFVDVPEGVS